VVLDRQRGDPNKVALTADPAWCSPADTWADLIDRYVRFRRVKAWRGRTHQADGALNPNRLTAVKAASLRHLLSHRVEWLLAQGMLPKLPGHLRKQTVGLLISRFAPHREFSKSPGWLQDLWRAILLNRDCYTCCYCRRTAWDTHRELGATLRFELDHKRAKARLPQRDDFDLRNICAACRSCNVIKGQMQAGGFLRELQSLARATLRSAAGHRR
jgi:5-methylcytosine-specific restriction endonuclease McrA